MLTMEEWMDLKLLSVQGHSIRAIAEMTGLSRNTVRRALRQKTPQGFANPKRKSKLEEYKAYVEKRYNECALSAVRLEEEIRGMGYEGGVDTVRRYVRTLQGPSRSLKKLTVRFETEHRSTDAGSGLRFLSIGLEAVYDPHLMPRTPRLL